RSFRQRWICSGIKEYTETQSRAANSPLYLSATDGLVSRLYCAQKTGPYVVVAKYSPTNWIDRATPLTLTYYFMDNRLSDLVEQARVFRCTRSRQGAAETIDVTINVRQPDVRLRLHFDAQHRLVTREVLLKESGQKEFDLHRRLELVDYESHRAADGATIWFPRRVISTIYVKDDKGADLPCQRMTFTVLESKFNETIPDSQFVLAIPEGTPILGQEDEPAK
ncbi:MAG: hypothetical protein ABUL64_03095, partial [Singulisphaera sp.]